MAVIDLPVTNIPIWMFTAPTALPSYLMIPPRRGGSLLARDGELSTSMFCRVVLFVR